MSQTVLQTCFSTAWGGLEMVAFELACRMRDDGVSVVTACTPGSPLAEKLTAAGLEVLPVTRDNKYLSPGTVRTLRRALKSGRIGAVLVEQLNELWQVVPALWGRRDLRVVGISHTLLGVRKKDFFHRRLYGRLDHLVALTSIHRANLLDSLPVRAPEVIHVIPNAVDLRRFNPSRRDETLRRQFLRAPEELLLGVVSRIDKGKGLLEVVAAASRLKDRGIAFRLVIVGRETIGEEGMMQTLRDEIARLGLSEHVFLLGHRQDVETIMASLDVMIMPSPQETFGRVLIEAMASGTAVIASAGGGVPDIIRHGEDGWLVPPLDAGALADAVTVLAQEPERRNRLAQRGLEAARTRYDQKTIDRQLYSLLGV